MGHDTDVFRPVLDPSAAYATSTGIADYLSTRQSDGNRPQIYADWIGGLESQGGVLIGLGCADSAVEAAVCRRMEPAPRACIGVDIAIDAGGLSAPRFADLPVPFTFVEGDWRDHETCAAIAEVAGEAGRIVLLAGRTFGNSPTPTILGELRVLAEKGSVYLDFFCAFDNEAERRFLERMEFVALNAAEFLLAPLKRMGVVATDAVAVLETIDEGHAIRADFNVAGTYPPGHDRSGEACTWRAFSIRMFRPDSLAHKMHDCGFDVLERLEMPEQVLPMALWRLQERC